MSRCGHHPSSRISRPFTTMSLATDRSRLSKIALLVGFGALLVGTLTAYRDPATGYELSIYRGTPWTFWAGVGVALVASLTVAMARRDLGLLRDSALVLGEYRRPQSSRFRSSGVLPVRRRRRSPPTSVGPGTSSPDGSIRSTCCTPAFTR